MNDRNLSQRIYGSAIMARLFDWPVPMRRHFSLLLILLAALQTGCTYFRLPILQGNVVKSEDAAAIQPGMSRTEVRDRLGTPLVDDSFGTNRWDYVVFYRDPKGKETRRTLSIHFANDTVAQVDGQPAFAQANKNNATAAEKPESVPTDAAGSGAQNL